MSTVIEEKPGGNQDWMRADTPATILRDIEYPFRDPGRSKFTRGL